MIRAIRRHIAGAVLFVAFVPAGIGDAQAASYAGRPVVEVLQGLRDAGLEFIYSSELVPPTLRVLAEPRSGNRLLIARDILAPHGLALSAVRPGLYAVVPAERRGRDHPLEGLVTDAASGKPVATARLELLPAGAVGWSDAAGRFSVGPVPAGDYTLRVDAPGFETRLRDVAVSAGTPVEVQLERARTELAEVVVSTSRYALERAGMIDSVHLDGDAISAQPVIGEDAIRALGRLPGMSQTGASAQSAVRGGEAGELLTLLDGFPLRQAFHMPGYQSVFGVLDPGLIEDAEIYTGGFPVRYGNRMSGVFDLRTIEADSDPATALGLSVFNAMARRGGNYQRLGADWLAAARVGTLKPFVRALAHDAGDPDYADAYARAGFGDPARLRVTANALWSRDRLSIERERQDEEARIESENRYFWLRADRDWMNGVSGSLWLGHSGVDSDRTGSVDNPGISTGTVSDHRTSEYWEARARLAWQPRPRHSFEAGIEWTDEDARYNYAAEATYTDAVAALFSRDTTLVRDAFLDPDRERIALFGAYRWRLSRDLITELGLRAQRTITKGTTAEDWLYDPRFNFRWQVAPATSLRVHWGRFHQTDEVHELKVEDGLVMFPEAQRSEQLIAGLDHRFEGGLALRVEAFRKRQGDPRPHFENLLDPLSLIPEIAPDRVMVAPSSAEIRGVELSLIRESSGYTWWTSLAWSEAWDRVEGERVSRSWDQTWAATAGVDWTRRTWRFAAVAGAHRGWPTTQVSATELGERNASRFPTRGFLDLRAERRRPLATGSLTLTFELTNAVNIGNTCCSELVAGDDGTGTVIFSTRKSDWLPLVPSVGVLWEF
ncbi:MAG: TonB-dependent receptor [Steroidobacteraceae bacterium]